MKESTVRLFFPLPLSAVVWSGYLMFEDIIPVIGLVVFSIMSYLVWHNEILIFDDEEESQKTGDVS